MLLPLLLFPGIWAYDEMKEYNCHTLRGRYSRNEMICGAAINEDEKCEEMSRTRDTVARLYSNPPKDFTMATGEHLCEISFTGRCASETFDKKSDDLCLTISRKDLPYNDAIRDCEKNGGSLYVPDSDYELNHLIEQIDGEIDHFWLGGGSIFSRTCRDPSQGKSEESAVMYMITERDNRFLGYATNRITSIRAPYICAKPRGEGDQDNCLGAPKAPATTTQPPPPRCSLQLIPHNHRKWLLTCFNDGSLKYGDKLAFQGQTPPRYPKIAADQIVWSFRLEAIDRTPLFHVAIKAGWNTIVVNSPRNGWAKPHPMGKIVPCPFTPASNFTVELTNNPENLELSLNGRSFTFNHPVAGDNNNRYYFLHVRSYNAGPLKMRKIAVIRNGTRSEIGLGVEA